MSKIQISTLRPGVAGSNVNYAHYSGLFIKDNKGTAADDGDFVWFYNNSDNTTLYMWTQTALDVAPSQITSIAGSSAIGALNISCQDSAGNVHFTGMYAGGSYYIKCTLTRDDDGHVTGWSFGTRIALPSMTSPLGTQYDVWPGSVAVIPNGDGTERVIIVFIDGNGDDQFATAICHAPLSPTATADFVSLSGTASTWTKFPTQTSSTNIASAYCHNAAIESLGTGGNFFVDSGPASRGDNGNYGSALVGFLCTASGTTWTVDTANPKTLATETYESLCGHSCKDSSGNAYFLWTKRTLDSGTGTVGLSKVATDGTFTANWLSTTFSWQGEVRGFPVIADDGTVFMALDPGDAGSAGTRPEVKVYSDGYWYSYWPHATRWYSSLAWITHGSRGWRKGLIWAIGDSAYPANLSMGSIQFRSGSEVGVLYDNYSFPVYSGTATISPTYATAVPNATRDMHVAIVAQKSTSTSGGTFIFPSGWTPRGEILGAGGYDTQGADTGNVDIAMATADTVNGAETGSIDVTLGSYDSAWAMQIRATKAGDGAWEYASTTGSDISGAADVSITYGSVIDLSDGDLLIIGFCIPTDVDFPRKFTAPAISATGITFGEVFILAEPYSTTGNDIGGWVGYVRVLSGSGSVVPTLSLTAAGTTTNVRGGSVILRLREKVASTSSVIVSSDWSNLLDGYMLVDDNWNSLIKIQILLDGAWVNQVP